jgi:ABC-type glycerol-3-phosphate transport system permease component
MATTASSNDENSPAGAAARLRHRQAPPEFTLDNYETILFSGDSTDGMAKAFFNTLTVTIPATIIPIVIAAFAAYALAWMELSRAVRC